MTTLASATAVYFMLQQNGLEVTGKQTSTIIMSLS